MTMWGSILSGSMKRTPNLLSFLIIMVLPSVSVFSQTEVSGTNVNAKWTAADYTYIAAGDFRVVTLTIEPGVVIRFNGDSLFESEGLLTAEGHIQNPIVISKNSSDIRQGGIDANSAQSASFAGRQIEWSRNRGIRIRSSS